jgi:asparagine synthase (glutamine-hydrolysing)
MCGITGFMTSASNLSLSDATAVGKSMVETLTHRGPDQEGIWTEESSLVLAHRRLAVLDLSASASQPMTSDCGRYVIVFNGEIYNHRDIRSQLCKEDWRGTSDTETLLAAFQTWGVSRTLQKIVGMFAIALWDRHVKELTLARDRFGEKPLFYGWQGGSLLFGSELKSLTVHPGWQGELDRNALTLYVKFGYVPLPLSIWRGISKLPPGSFLTLPLDLDIGELPKPIYFWRAVDLINLGETHTVDDVAAVKDLELVLGDAISGQMVADVPIGAFLSGGVDSSAVVALMQQQTTIPVKTFSIGFSESGYDEAKYAQAVATHLGTDHSELYVSGSDAFEVIPKLPDMYDEPFADSSQIPTFLIASLARTDVTVSLTGDGADELFGGYNRHVLGPSILKFLGFLPLMLRRIATHSITAVSPSTWDFLAQLIPGKSTQPMFGDRAHKLANILTVRDLEEMYTRLVSYELNPGSIVIGSNSGPLNQPLWAKQEMMKVDCIDQRGRMMFNDTLAYLTDDILCKVDRAAMSASLETRAPFLDHRVAEFAWGLPTNMKIREGSSKWLVRQLLYKYVPKDLIERPKQGFGVPIGEWLRGPLRDWAEYHLAEPRLREQGFLYAEPIRLRWKDHLKGRRNWQHFLWNVLMFQVWLERWNP